MTLTPSQSKGIEALQSLAHFGSITATAQYLENDAQRRSRKDTAVKWVNAAEKFVSTLPKSEDARHGDASNPLIDDRISEFIALEARRAFSTLVTCYEDRWPSAKTAGQNDEVSIETLRAAQRSLEFIESRTVPSVVLYRNIVQIDRALDEFQHAKDSACRAIRMGAQDEVFFYAAAAAAKKEGKDVESYQICEGYKGNVTIPEFEALRKKYQMSPI